MQKFLPGSVLSGSPYFVKLLFVLSVLCFGNTLRAQQSVGDFIRTIDSLSRINQHDNRSLHNKRFPSANRIAKSRLQSSFNVPSFSRPFDTDYCRDTSSKVSIGKDSINFYVGVSTKTRDGNLLISGEYYDFWDPVSGNQGFLMKCDPYGNVIWAKLYDSAGHKAYDYLNNYYVIELMDGSILMAGGAPDVATDNDDLILTRTDANGNILWTKDYFSTAWTRGNGSADYFNLVEMKQDPFDGSVYISSPTWGDGTYVIKVNISDGSIPWSNIFRLYTNGYGFQAGGGVAIRPDDLVAFSTVSPYNSTMVLMYRINKATGDTFNTRLLTLLDTPYYQKGFVNFQSVQQLPNGNILLAGPLYGYYRYQYNGIDPLYQAGVLELNSSLDFVRSYVFRNNIENNFSNTRITLHPDGSGIFNMLHVKSGYTADQYFVQFKDGMILKERKRNAFNEGYGYENPALQLSNGGELMIQIVGDSISNNSRVVFTKLHLSDTSSDCLGHGISNTGVEEVQYGEPRYAFMDSTKHFVMQERSERKLTITPYHVAAPRPACFQIGNCDTLMLSATADTICPQTAFYITARKNRACGSKVQFTYDTSSVESFTPVNDSVYRVIYKAAWKGFIKGSLAGCNLYMDSVPVTVLKAPPFLNLGPDTAICPGNQIMLNARSGYKNYRWQDGSSDSLIIVTFPGKYYVTVTNACGDIFTDTIMVTPHAPIPLYIGADTAICNHQQITLNAPGGFINYKWDGPAVTIDSLPVITVSPQASGWYSITVTQTPGCFASDSLYVNVKQMPPLWLGNDTSICGGSQLSLDAGNRFDNYTWNTGQHSRGISVSQAGIYTLEASLNGCTARDTFEVKNIYPLPVFSLGGDSTLCRGNTLQLTINLPQATYEWSSREITGSINIKEAGSYWLRVTQNGCSSTDTIKVTYLDAPVFYLGKDSTLCRGQTLLLDATSGVATYVWQDGSTAPTYNVHDSGEYRVTAAIGHCAASDTIRISYIQEPSFNLGRDTFLCTGQQIVLSAAVNSSARLLWQDGSSAVTYTVTKPGLYSLQATNACGSAIDEITIEPGSCLIEMPSAFTPNGDGINDIFKVRYPFAVQQFRMVIYNRYGEQIYRTNDINHGWDGSWKGQRLLMNSFVWTISYTDINNRQWQLQGTVLLLR